MFETSIVTVSTREDFVPNYEYRGVVCKEKDTRAHIKARLEVTPRS